MSSAAQQDAETFDPAVAECWIARGRKPEHAAALATVWRDFPDLPSGAPTEDRMARMKSRTQAMKPVFDAIAAEQAAELEERNFASVERSAVEGKGSDRDLAVLRGRDDYGYGWDLSHRYADGWCAAHSGRPHSYSEAIPSRTPIEIRRAAYDRGFADGGGDRDDIFDVARRAYFAQLRKSNMVPPPAAPIAARPLPSAWLKPTDRPRPARWDRRLVILSDADIATEDPKFDYLKIIQERRGADQAKVLVLTNEGFVDGGAFVPPAGGPRSVSADAAAQQLRDHLAGREFDDILVALQGADLALLDQAAGALPLCRSMERTRNTRLQFRAHLKVWLDRGVGGGDNVGAGHIRWGKMINGVSGKLGEFTARYAGPAQGRGHLVRVETAAGQLAFGFATADGVPLAPEIIVSSKARLRAEVAKALRAFTAATPIMYAAAARSALPAGAVSECGARA